MSNDQTPSTKLYVPAMAGLYDGLSGLAYPFIRFVTGLWAMPHGAGKLFGWFGLSIEGTAGFFAKIGLEPALPLAYLVGMTEFFGGLALVIGLWTRPAAASPGSPTASPTSGAPGRAARRRVTAGWGSPATARTWSPA